ncbi:aspartate aminotransferase family protein [Actinokineospora auranticolor]|uniref:Glutamate/tyrosine decarboxylase-like PLP-dependent enzyme n=1 Tax=Actinokineospora auranticolor TaxID=155976 RepID=A0A2S6GS97_9PSEU|nr:aspartate aminotransferase family protein [Actinokineospora auranticolor]PPK68069.1 glutamate/tyrosine decarboxylase-like PLP-dependent enzyme [Actinokineospora auranticolor]
MVSMDLPETSLPAHGTPREELFADLRARKSADADWRAGRTWSLIYPAGEDVDAVLREAHELYLYENALNPFRFPSLADMEREVVAMTAGLLHAPPGASGSLTSGGTESIMQAIRVARDRAAVESPALVVPRSAHPAFAKGAKYFGLELRQIPLDAALRADVSAAAELIDERTVLVAGSAPNYPHGVVDPIPELAALAASRGIPFHTDACVGGFLLPFLPDAPAFDFRVPGVTTMSADVHKYGYATKGASVLLHRNGDHVLQYQAFLYQDWPGGLYGSLALAGARPAAPIAAAWAVMRYLGVDGYTRLVRRIMATVAKIRAGSTDLGLELLGDPAASVLAFTAPNIMAIGDEMDDRGWHLDRQNDPDALHLMVSPEHDRVVDRFLTDLRDSVDNAGQSRGVQARYS